MDVLFAIFFGFSIIPTNALQCNSSSYKWASNSDRQDPCQLVSQLRSSCAPNADPLQPLSYNPFGTNHYPGPTFLIQNICTCSYVMYNLMTACGDCQTGLSAHPTWPTYNKWANSCDPVNTDGIYPDAIPSGFWDSIPGWARFSMKGGDEFRWSYGLSRALASDHVLANSKLISSIPRRPAPACSATLPIGTAFAGLLVGLFLSGLAFFLRSRRRAHVIPPPTRYHTAPDNTPLVPLVPRAAYAHGTSFLRRILELGHEDDPRRIEPFDISTAAGGRSFPPHPAAFPPRRVHAFPPAVSVSAPSQESSRGPSRQTSLASFNASPLATRPVTPLFRSQSYKTHSRPQTVNSFFTAAESPIAGPSMLPLHDQSSSEPPSPLPPDRQGEDPPAYQRKS